MTVGVLKQLTARLRFLYTPGDRATNQRYQRDIASTRRAVGGLAAANMAWASSQNAVTAAMAGTASQMKGIAAIGAVFGVGLGGVAILNSADALDEMNNRLRAVVGNREDIEDLRRSLTRLSVLNFSNIDDTVQVFQRFKIGTEDLGKTTNEILTFTDSVQKSAALAGATTEETNNALIQFAQGIASNRFSGEEFRSVSEQLPPLLRVLKRDLGKTTGELREMAFAGQLTADVIFGAFERQRETILTEFENIQVTQQKAAQNLQTGIITFFGKFGQGVGLNRTVANLFQGVAEAMLAAEQAAFRFGLTFRGVFRAVFDLSNEVWSILNPLFSVFNGAGEAFKPLLDFFSVYNTLRDAGQGAGEAFNNALSFFFDPQTAAILKQTAQSIIVIGKVLVGLATLKFAGGVAGGVGKMLATIAGSAAMKRFRVAAIMLLRYRKAWSALALIGRSILRAVFTPLNAIILGLQVAMAAWNRPNSKLKALWERLVELWNGGPNGEGLGAAFKRLGAVLVPILTLAFESLVSVVEFVAGLILGIVNGMTELYNIAKKLLGLEEQSPEQKAAIESYAAERGIGVVNANGRAQYNAVDYMATSRGMGQRPNVTNIMNVDAAGAAKVVDNSQTLQGTTTQDGVRRLGTVGG